MSINRLLNVGLNRILLSSDAISDHANVTYFNNTEHDEHESSGCHEDHESHDLEEAFEHIYFVMLFMACLWFVGKLFARLGLPSLVGEILCGIILGPNLVGMVPYSDALIVIGEVGLVLLVLEAGIDVSIGHLKVVGYRGLAVAVFGSMIPLAIGTGLAILYGEELQSAIAIGACLAPTSMGIALNVLRNGKVLNTPTGQLIIAAAVLDDVIALMLLSELEAFADPTPLNIILPLIVSPLFILFFGALAIWCTPWLIQKIMTYHKVKKKYHENIILFLLFCATFILIPVCFYAGSSHLLGAFLAGLMFCTDHTIHEAWNNQIKRIMQWMLRIFFACTIGFAVPIQDFWTKEVLGGAFLYFIAIVGKLATGIFAKPFTVSEFFTIGFSMSAWGEFAFILATASYGSGTMDKDAYSSVLMAVLMSVIISPLCLRMTLYLHQKSKAKKLTDTRDSHWADGKGSDHLHPVYFCVHTKGRGKWGHQDKLLHSIFELNLEIIDFRAFNEAEYNHSHHLPLVQDIFYVQDKKLMLPPTKRLGKKREKELQNRYRDIKRKLRETMGDPHSSVDVMRWLPGVRKSDDADNPQSPLNKARNAKKKRMKKPPAASYCRKEAYRQARLALDHEEQVRSFSHLTGVNRIRPHHDAMYKDKFSYHGGIHTEEDDLIAMAFLDTLTSLQTSLSPLNRASPSGSGDPTPLDPDELFEKINTLRNCVAQLPAFQSALSDDGRLPTNFSNLSASSQHSNNIHDPPHAHASHTIRSFFNETNDLSLKNDLSVPTAVRTRTEHGNIRDITHHPLSKHTALKPRVPAMPGMFSSRSHGSVFGPHSNGHHAGHAHGHHDHHQYHGHHYYHMNIPSRTHSSDHHHPLHHSSDDHTEPSRSYSHSDDFHVDTMYGDEDEHHRPLHAFSNLENIEEPIDEPEDEDDERDNEEIEDDTDKNYKITVSQTVRLKSTKSAGDDTEEKKAEPMKRSQSALFSKLKKSFKKHHEHSDEDEHHEKHHHKKKIKLKLLHKKNKKNDKFEHHATNSTSSGVAHWDENEDEDSPLDPKFLQMPDKSEFKKNTESHQSKSKIGVKSSSSISPPAPRKDREEIDDNDEDEGDGETGETQPLKSNNDDH